MRLLNTTTYVVKIFDNEDDLPPYAILSHVWGKPEEEVTFADMQDLKLATRREGWSKLKHFCALAIGDGLEWGWEDTCCIDKSSSGELSQAINSMYAWYGGARVCYAYLSDVDHPGKEDPAAEGSSFRRSRWFKRGWTLQELIAPKVVLLYSKSWKPLGSKVSLAGVIEEITNIDAAVLMHTRRLDDVSIARRMSWASARETWHVEDRAYSLMGIFGIHMPTIYGEGRRAFIRLQLEILRTSTDQSIFAWGHAYDFQVFLDNASAFTDLPAWATEFRCLLASSPDGFFGSANIVPFPIDQFTTYTHPKLLCDTPEYTLTNSGTQIHLPVYMHNDTPFGFALLACKHATTGELVSLFVHRRESSTNRFYVGMYTPNMGPMAKFDWHPRFRMFLMQPRRHVACSRILQNVKLARVYLHSYNANPQRSIAQGLASGDLILRRGTTVRCVDHKPRRVSFILYGALLKQLEELELRIVGYGETRPALAGWTPRALWRQEPGVGLKLTLEHPPANNEGRQDGEQSPPPSQAAVLFRCPPSNAEEAGSAFALIFGVTASGTVWATVAIVKRDLPVDGRDADHAGHKLVRSLLAHYSSTTEETAISEGYDVSQWTKGTYEHRVGLGDAPQRVVRVTLTRWSPREEPDVPDQGSVMTYTVGVEVDLGPGMRLWAISEEEKIERMSGLSDIVVR
ncbi:heterokaryon incompatibility protein-domain-containing protein [Cerioporus squamosus]|nr:heterokaryon incompatibility protein-domain-containing protein [Cerioporus squamosus]